MTVTQEPLHKAAVVVRSDSSFRFEVRSVPIPQPKPWEVLVKLSATGVCGTDMGLAAGHLGPSCDILGHEGVGRVVRIGDGVDPSIVKTGDRVGIAWVRDVCGRCSCCREPGGETRCRELQNSGRNWDGTFAEHCVVPSRYVLVLPEDSALPDELIAPVLCGGVTAYKAVKTCGATPGEWVAVVGAAGGVGGLAVQYAKAMGYQVAAVDVGPSQEACLKAGADAYFDATDPNIVSALKKVTPDEVGAKAVVVTANSGKAYQTALDLVAVFGTLVCVGIPPPDQPLTLHPITVMDRGIRIIGTLVGTRTDTLEALEFVRRGAVKPVVNTVGFDQLNDVTSKFGNITGKFVAQF
ncbi:PKS-ER domain-containing protein [Fusarium keratoplasticum]|uniref:PKS-ER domain-containing protein n=1 Tax=Fusarium keratoplasticum TaxID=1328300 RepID=A0ACC0R293_9HYPO|nr:PKS-ER domain-containing protein [Fusarium keratoplasticum]KAI8671828.1 PKS-ER domain-containing protein [Fusarium keratoplasticum]